MQALEPHMAEGHLSGRVIAMAAIVLLLCAIALGFALLGLQVLTTGGTDTDLGTFDVHAPALLGADGASQPFSGPDEITEQARSLA